MGRGTGPSGGRCPRRRRVARRPAAPRNKAPRLRCPYWQLRLRRGAGGCPPRQRGPAAPRAAPPSGLAGRVAPPHLLRRAPNQHLLRTVPPFLAHPYASAHDDAMWATLSILLGEEAPLPDSARAIAFLPARLGGLGLLASVQIAPAAYWAAWADALPVLAQRQPDAAARCAAALAADPPAPAACLREAAAAGLHLDASGWAHRPPGLPSSFTRSGPPRWMRGSPAASSATVGVASLAIMKSFHERDLLPSLSPPARALLRSKPARMRGHGWLRSPRAAAPRSPRPRRTAHLRVWGLPI